MLGGYLGIAAVLVPMLAGISMLAVGRYRWLVVGLGVIVPLSQAAILLNMPSESKVPGLGLVFNMSELSLVLLLATYGCLAIQSIFATHLSQGQWFSSLCFVLNAGLTMAVLLGEQLVVAGLILVAVTVVTVYGVASHARNVATLDVALRVLIAATMAAVAFIVATLVIDAYDLTHDQGSVRMVAALLSVAMGLIAGVFPLNMWVPKIVDAAPSMVSVWIVGLVGAVALALMVFSVEAYPWLHSSGRVGEILRWGAAVGALVTAFLALTSKKTGRLVVFSAASNISVCIVGIACASTTGLIGSSFVLVVHILAVLLLMMALGLMQARNDSQAVVGEAHSFDLSTFALLVGGLTIAGVPPLGGFAGRWDIYQAAVYYSKPLVGTLLLASVMVVLAYLRCLPSRKSIGEDEPKQPTSVVAQACIYVVGAVLLCLGLFPSELLSAIGATIAQFPGLG